MGLASWYVIQKHLQRERLRLAEVEARKERTERAVAQVRAFRPIQPPDPPDMAQAEEMLQQVNRQMAEAMHGMDLRLGQAMQQANVSMERAMENMAQVMASSRLRGRQQTDLFTITHGAGGPGDVVIRDGNATGPIREIRIGLPSGGVSITLTSVPPEPPKPLVEEKLPPTIYERLNQEED